MKKRGRKKENKILKWTLIILGIVLISSLIAAQFPKISFLFTPNDHDVLFFYHWWTSAGERAALNALVEVFINKYPEIIVVPSSLVSKSSSGGGIELFNVLKSVLQSNEPPDAFQMHAGYETKAYYEANLLDNVDDVWKKENLEEVVPKMVQVMCKFDNHYYSVPANIHRTNVVWYNKELLDENNILATKLTTWETFFEACDKLKSAGVEYPIQLAAAWTAQHTFDQIVASQGIDFYEDWVNGKVTSENDPRLLNALETFKKYLTYVNPDNANTEWDTAIKRVINKESAFNIMGDWANGECKAKEIEYNKDYGTFVVPGTINMYGLVIDTFQQPKKPQHPESAEKWLEVVGSQEGQDAFNPLKGSISARTDTDVSKYGKYQQTAIFDFISAKYMYPAVSNGAPKEFEVKEQQIIAEFVKDKDVQKAAKALTDYTRDIANSYTITWELN